MASLALPYRRRPASDRFATAFKHRVLHHAGHALPDGTIEAGDHVDAHDLHELVFELHGVDRAVMHVGDRRDSAGTLILGIGIDGLYGLIRRGAMTAQIDE